MVTHDFTQVSNEINKVYQWLCANKLSLNIKKTKVMIFHNKNKVINYNQDIKLLDTPIEIVRNFNFLGVILNETLNWNSHIDTICRRISRHISVFHKLKHYLPVYILKTLYFSLGLSYCTYGIIVWGSNTNRLYQLQKKAVHVITLNKYNAHTEPLFKSLELLKIQDIYVLTVLKFYYKHCHNQLPHHLQGFTYQTCSSVHHYDTRNKNYIYISKTRTRLAENSLRYISAKVINSTSENILSKIQTHSLQGFSFYIKQQYLNNYETTCTQTNCYICLNT